MYGIGQPLYNATLCITSAKVSTCHLFRRWWMPSFSFHEKGIFLWKKGIHLCFWKCRAQWCKGTKVILSQGIQKIWFMGKCPVTVDKKNLRFWFKHGNFSYCNITLILCIFYEPSNFCIFYEPSLLIACFIVCKRPIEPGCRLLLNPCLLATSRSCSDVMGYVEQGVNKYLRERGFKKKKYINHPGYQLKEDVCMRRTS